jgi:hypothetical protein
MRRSAPITITFALLSTSAWAQMPELGDIAACNNQAHVAVHGPSASPGVTGQRPEMRPSPPAQARGRIQTDPSGSIVTRSPDPLLQGMATDGLDDPAYQAAYRECMSKRLHR